MRHACYVFLLLCSAPAFAQLGAGGGSIEISGIVRLEGKPAPQGTVVLLDIAPTRDQAVAGTGEIDRTITDSSGKFIFPNIGAAGRGNTKLFSITTRFPGYKEAYQIVDLTFSNHGYVSLDLKRDRSHDPVNLPPEGAGATISAHQPATPEAQAALAKGETLLLQKHDPKASIESFKKLVKLDPNYTPGYVLLGTAYIQRQEWPEAKSVFEKATKLDPSNAQAFLGLGASLNAQQDFPAAQKVLIRSILLKPDSAEAQYELARALWGEGQWQDAEPHARKSIEINRYFPMSHIVMGNIYLRHRDAKSALQEFQEYLRLDPEGEQSEAVKVMIAKIQKALAER